MTYTLPAPTDRHLILIDIENLAGCPAPSAYEIEAVIALLRSCIPGYDDDQQIVACSHHAAPAVAFAFPSARRIWRSGRDGADLALLDVIETEGVADRYQRVTLCSGDGIFAEAVAALASRGVDVTAVSLAGHLATRLRLAARNLVLLPTSADVAIARGAR